MDGETLRSICADKEMPNEDTVYGWLLKPDHLFSEPYAHARQVRAARMLDEILEISDDARKDYLTNSKTGEKRVDRECLERSRLKVDTRKWIMAKVLPKLYGDRLSVSGPDGGAIQVQYSASPELIAAMQSVYGRLPGQAEIVGIADAPARDAGQESDGSTIITDCSIK